MNKDCGIHLNKINVDGIMTANSVLMQLQADLCGIPVCMWCFKPGQNEGFNWFGFPFSVRSHHRDTTSLGVAMAAGQAEGINVYNKWVQL